MAADEGARAARALEASGLLAVLSFLADFVEDGVVGVLHGFVSLLFAPEISMEHGEREYGECQSERHDRLPELETFLLLQRLQAHKSGSTALECGELTTILEIGNRKREYECIRRVTRGIALRLIKRD
jgi:hypothetical protein